MVERFVLFLTDEEIILYKGSRRETYAFETYDFKKGIEHIQTELKKALSLTPKAPLSLMIDRNHQDIHEELLPSLLPWDRMSLLSHKREEWKSQGTFHGYYLFKQDRQSFLQWVNIAQNDPLVPWLSWIKSLSQPLLGIFFVSLEAGEFLRKHVSLSGNYDLLIYKISENKIRYVIFKDKRLLLYRPFAGEEGLRSSLHFLSRSHPDIHEKLQVVSLIKDISLSLPHVTALPNPHAFIDFLGQGRGKTLSLKSRSSSQNQWVDRGMGVILFCALLLTGVIVYQSLQYKQKIHIVLSNIETLKNQIQKKKGLLENKDVHQLRSALDHYDHLKSQMQSPFGSLKKLSILLEKHPLHLQRLTWQSEETTSLEISFFMKNDRQDALAHQFQAILSSLRAIFLNSHLHIMEAPFKSGSHETYQYPPSIPFPMTQLRITEP